MARLLPKTLEPIPVDFEKGDCGSEGNCSIARTGKRYLIAGGHKGARVKFTDRVTRGSKTAGIKTGQPYLVVTLDGERQYYPVSTGYGLWAAGFDSETLLTEDDIIPLQIPTCIRQDYTAEALEWRSPRRKAQVNTARKRRGGDHKKYVRFEGLLNMPSAPTEQA